MENIDDLMRQKFDNDDPAGRFEFREEYWEQARALIEADEARRRKRRRWLLWWTFAGLLLVSAGAGMWYLGGSRQTSDAATTATGQSIGATSGEQQNTAGAGETARLTDTEKAASFETTTSNILANNTVDTENHPDRPADNTPGNQLKNSEKQFTQHSSRLPKKTTPATQNQQNNPLSATENTREKGLPSVVSPRGLTAAPEPGKSSDKTGVEPTLPATPAAADDNRTESPASIRDNKNNAVPGVSPTDETARKLEKLLEQLFTLPLPLQQVSRLKPNDIPEPDKVDEPMATQIKPVREPRFAVSVSGAAAAFQPSPDQRWLGFSGGAQGIYRLNKHWSASLGVGLRFQPGSWLDSTGTDISETLRYSFGYKSVYAERRAVGLLSLEIPLAATWQTRSITLQAGMAPGRLLYALDRYKQITASTLEGQKINRNRLEKHDKAPFGLSYLNAFAGAEWQLLPNISLILRGNYRFGALVKANAETEQPAIRGGSNVELGVRLKLFEWP